MTFHVGMFEGDSNAGWKKPYRGKARAWFCCCRYVGESNKKNPGYLSKCPDCKLERPK